MTQYQGNITQKTLPYFKIFFEFTAFALACASMTGCLGNSESKINSGRITRTTPTITATATTVTTITPTTTVVPTPAFDSAALTSLQERGWTTYSRLKLCQAEDEHSPACTANTSAAATGFYVSPNSETYYKDYIANVARPSLGYELDPAARYSSLSQATKDAIMAKVIRYCSGGSWDTSPRAIGFTHYIERESSSTPGLASETPFPSLSTLNVRDAIINLVNSDLYSEYCAFVDEMLPS